ncbi:carbohydrate ABC transporter permease [Haploplasma axanthum]|uniref:sn-glycerol-3-phosphate transport system permease protein ugpA n=1 Tax=Haploplasma axanthum TaxID=29552 RepID=A0A449BBH2_HAPAX|nr:sugar ABC transporter permease [Haploplasma axanthum]VEU79771.1 sn-glycerol-3-phosphate transport system permease protein ugpA [Haploplasma axanthum]
MREKTIKYYSHDEVAEKKKKIEKTIIAKQIKHQKITKRIQELQINLQSNKRVSKKKIIILSNKASKIEAEIKRERINTDLLNEGKLEKHNQIKRIRIWFSGIEYQKQRRIWGIIFITPWILGMLLFFLPSVLTTIYWSLNNVTLTNNGVATSFNGFKNFSELFGNYVIDGSNIFSVQLLLFVQNLAIDLPVIIIFSVIIAVLLNKKFKGHLIIKAIFFIPVIYNLTVITSTLTGSFGQFVDDALSGQSSFVEQTTNFFLQIGVGESIMKVVLNSVDRIFTIVNLSGIQILIFIAAIQSVPKHLYEAAAVEGATKYESFWKITIPMITPMIITASIYTVVDSFTRAPIFRFLDYAMSDGKYGLAATISVSYFIINLVIVGIIYLLFKGRVFYYDEE